MNRRQLEHIIRAAAAVADENDIVIIGSQAILGQFPDAPAPLLVSMEADVFPKTHPERSDLIDGTLGEGSYFHETFGYYAQGVDETTAVVPVGWKDRLVKVTGPGTQMATGWALEANDLMISKYVANRPKDREFVREAAHRGLAHLDVLLSRLDQTPVDESLRTIIRANIRADFKTTD